VISSIVTTIITDGIKSRGQVKLYYKIVFSKFNNQGTWGFHNSDDGIMLDVPMWIEVYNTSNTARVIRNINILLFNNNKEISQMVQINKINNELYGNYGNYSFVVQPRSIVKYSFHFAIKKNQIGNNSIFDELKLRYYDEKDKLHIGRIKNIKSCWELGDFDREGTWKLANM